MTGRRRRSTRTLLPILALACSSAIGALLVHEPPGRLHPALAWSPPSLSRPFGCGEAGVDLLAVVAHAQVQAILLAGAVALTGWLVGVPLGAAAALAQGRFERLAERACDLVQAFPTFILALAVLSAVRVPSRAAIGVVFAITAWAPFARLSLAQTRTLRDASFIEAAVALGRGPATVLVRHIIPNLLSVAGVQLGSSAGAMVVSEAGLAFLGFGPRDGVSLGAVLDQGVASMFLAPHVLVVGSASVFVTSAALLVAGQWFESGALNDATGP